MYCVSELPVQIVHWFNYLVAKKLLPFYIFFLTWNTTIVGILIYFLVYNQGTCPSPYRSFEVFTAPNF